VVAAATDIGQAKPPVLQGCANVVLYGVFMGSTLAGKPVLRVEAYLAKLECYYERVHIEDGAGSRHR